MAAQLTHISACFLTIWFYEEIYNSDSSPSTPQKRPKTVPQGANEMLCDDPNAILVIENKEFKISIRYELIVRVERNKEYKVNDTTFIWDSGFIRTSGTLLNWSLSISVDREQILGTRPRTNWRRLLREVSYTLSSTTRLETRSLMP